jgi:uncharacterized protein (TIGR03435 family)
MEAMRLGFLLATTLLGQTPAFEAASIKAADTTRTGSGINVEAARIRVINATLKFCVQVAFNVKDFQVSGGAGWTDSERFDIDAVAAKPFEQGEMRAMLQTLLAERFAVKIHRDTQEKQGYALVVAKNGPKMPPPVEDPSIMFSRTSTGDLTLSAKNVTMAQLASALSSNLGAIVVDRTGLDGKFDASMQWTPDRPMMSKSGEPIMPPADAVPGPSIFTVIQEKLGLKLESRKVPVEVIIVDHAEHPTAN